MKLTSEQEQILNGLLLGDGCLFLGKSNINPLLTVARAEKDLEYLKFQANIFNNLCSGEGIIKSNKHDKKSNKIYIGYKFRTRALKILKPYYKLWYPNSKKIVPFNLKITPLTMAHWFCDDGCISLKKDRNGHKSKAMILKLSTNSFTKEEVEFLHHLLSNRYGNLFTICKDSLDWYKKKNPYYKDGNKNYYIRTYTEGATNIFEDIKGVFPKGMTRKYNIFNGAKP